MLDSLCSNNVDCDTVQLHAPESGKMHSVHMPVDSTIAVRNIIPTGEKCKSNFQHHFQRLIRLADMKFPLIVVKWKLNHLKHVFQKSALVFLIDV